MPCGQHPLTADEDAIEMAGACEALGDGKVHAESILDAARSRSVVERRDDLERVVSPPERACEKIVDALMLAELVDLDMAGGIAWEHQAAVAPETWQETQFDVRLRCGAVVM
jgi:hypothetical protein